MEQFAYVVQFNRIVCIEKTDEGSKHDEVYFEVRTYSDPSNPDAYVSTLYYHDSPLEMNPSNQDGNRELDISIKAEGLHRIEFQLWERDNADRSKNKDDDLGTLTITQDNAQVTSSDICSEIDQPSHDRCGKYQIYWRVVNKPLPSLRILGIYCQKQSCGCNSDVIDSIFDAVSGAELQGAVAVCKAAGGKEDVPVAAAVSAGFLATAVGLQVDKVVIDWLGKVIEGNDDVYIQHLKSVEDDPTGGAFWPETGTHVEMTDDIQFAFVESYGHYYRFALDQGAVTIKVRERDPVKKDIDLGALTIGNDEYKKFNGQGAQIAVLSGSGNTEAGQEGAVYHLCYSVGPEDFAKDPTPSAQA